MMPAGRGATLSADLRHMIAVFRNALAALSSDLGHVLPIAGDCDAALSRHFLAGFGIHRSGATRAAQAV
jgi:hypothetical protein